METQSLEHSKKTRRPDSFIPILAWLPRYNRAWLVADILAGLTLWGLVVPAGMAYAGIADLPPQAGLYTLVASLQSKYESSGIPKTSRPTTFAATAAITTVWL